MRLRFDYKKAIESQCDSVNLQSSRKIFRDICKNLTDDFLPPIDREDIAMLSYSLLRISELSELTDKSEFKNQFIGLKIIVEGLFKKSKTCGDDIRRLMEINMSFNAKNNSAEVLKREFADFYKNALFAYFKNL